ncbi:DUF6584 family protein [Bacillus toyonensis]|uniref:DUF6584 family protein n=1 Tax=Bacillus toyonensis TaxID=155322 RepID=UPI000279DCBF|nr:DUF6584 family protein [Bacillus toyonensis]EJR59769.1 hypothetical protein IK3_04386 [Bacillus toyonensis]PDZ35132.1 DNA helicase [Bacillus toyonensis]PEI54076.1 DNA helicase [Bacillus toyonensis]PEJ17260.1 DNA helicase [Bacillus toyonensis]PEK16383.1 DNA helicase [Bacillus toyonensis]
MTTKIPKKTLKRIEEDIENNNLGKARERLHGLIFTYPNELHLRKQIGDIYYKLQYPEMAGRYWYLEEHKTDIMHESCLLFEKSMGNDPYHIARALKFKGDSSKIKKLYKEQPLSPIQKKVAEELVYEYKETWEDKLLSLGCLVFLAFLLFSAIVGIFTIWNWIF